MLSSQDVSRYVRRLFSAWPEASDDTHTYGLMVTMPGNFGWDVCVCKYEAIVPCTLGRMRYRDPTAITPWVIAGTRGIEDRIEDVVRIGQNSWAVASYDDLGWKFVPVRARSVEQIYQYACNIGPTNVSLIEVPHLFHVHLP